MKSAMGNVTDQGSLASLLMKLIMKTGTVGIRPIRAIEIRKATSHPKKIMPRSKIVPAGMWVIYELISMWIFSATSSLAAAANPRICCVSRLKMSLIRESEQNRIAPVPTMTGTIFA